MTNSPKRPELTKLHHGVTTRGRLGMAWLALAWERLWSRLWVPVAAVGVFIAVALTDVLPSTAFFFMWPWF